jgi:hypothetical protein
MAEKSRGSARRRYEMGLHSTAVGCTAPAPVPAAGLAEASAPAGSAAVIPAPPKVVKVNIVTAWLMRDRVPFAVASIRESTSALSRWFQSFARLPKA